MIAARLHSAVETGNGVVLCLGSGAANESNATTPVSVYSSVHFLTICSCSFHVEIFVNVLVYHPVNSVSEEAGGCFYRAMH